MKTKHKYYRDGDNYILMTGECPAAFKGVMYIVWEGELGALKEGLRTLDQLAKLEEVDEVPGDWVADFGRATGLGLVNDPKPTPKPTRASSGRRDTKMDEFVGHCAAGTDPITAMVASGVYDEDFPIDDDIPLTAADERFNEILAAICWIVGGGGVLLLLFRALI